MSVDVATKITHFSEDRHVSMFYVEAACIAHLATGYVASICLQRYIVGPSLRRVDDTALRGLSPIIVV